MMVESTFYPLMWPKIGTKIMSINNCKEFKIIALFPIYRQLCI